MYVNKMRRMYVRYVRINNIIGFLFISFQIRLFPIYQISDPFVSYLSVFRSLFLCKSSK